MKLLISLLLVLTLNVQAQNGRLIPNPIRKIPRWVRSEFSAQQYDQRYEITYQLYPPYLRADFNGDGKSDVAIPVAEKSSGKLGIAIIHGKEAQAFKNRIVILGAGKGLGAAGDDFKWLSLWSVLKNKSLLSVEERARVSSLHEPAIRAQKREGGAGLIFWDGKKYEWSSLSH